MIKLLSNFLIVASVTIFSCNHFEKHVEQLEGKENKGSVVDGADKIVYSYHPSSVAPKYYRGYTITVTANKLFLTINSYGDILLRKDWPFTQEKFNEVKEKLKTLKKDGEIDENEIPDGGTTHRITLYKNDDEIFSGENYGTTKNFSGADIDLSYLIPDLKELIDGTEVKE